jgi:hypothetical protein
MGPTNQTFCEQGPATHQRDEYRQRRYVSGADGEIQNRIDNVSDKVRPITVRRSDSKGVKVFVVMYVDDKDDSHHQKWYSDHDRASTYAEYILGEWGVCDGAVISEYTLPFHLAGNEVDVFIGWMNKHARAWHEQTTK